MPFELPTFQNRFAPKTKGRITPQSVVVYLGGGNTAFHGWEDLSISKNIDQLATSFRFRIPQKFRQENAEFKLTAGVRVQINVNGQPVIRGRIEQVSGVVSATENRVEVSGRSLTGDLVDCSVVGALEYTNIGLDTLATQLIKPFGLKLFLSATPKIIPRVSIKTGDTVFEVLDRYARLQGLFWVTTREGNLRLAYAGNSKADSRIEEDINLLEGSVVLDETQRFSKYIVKGQTSGTDQFPGVVSGAGKGEAVDAGVSRYRPLVLVAEGNCDSATALTRAKWEAGHRLAKAVQVNVTVQGWQQETGILWGLNQITKIKSKTLGIDGEFLSTSVEHVRTNTEGTLTKLGFALKDAYKPEVKITDKALNSLEAVVQYSKKNKKAVE